MKAPLPLLVLLSAIGCGAPRPASTTIVGIDTSGSAQRFLGAYATTTGALATMARPDKDRLYVYSFDRQARELYGPEPPFQTEEFAVKLVERLETAAGLGTHPAAFFEAAVRRAEESDLPITILCLTDGGNDDLSRRAVESLRTSAKSLSENPKVRTVAFAGVVPGQREAIRNAMTALGDKLRFVEFEDVLKEAF